MADREKVIKALELCTSKIETRTQVPCETCPYHNRKYHGVHGDGICNARSLQDDTLTLLKAHEQFLQWLARLVTHEDGDGAECEIICRRLREMGYVEKYEENGVEYWMAVKWGD